MASQNNTFEQTQGLATMNHDQILDSLFQNEYNLLDINVTLNIGYKLTAQGGIFPLGNSNVTDYQNIKNLRGKTLSLRAIATRKFCYYDDNKAYISIVSVYNTSFTIPNNATYWRIEYYGEIGFNFKTSTLIVETTVIPRFYNTDSNLKIRKDLLYQLTPKLLIPDVIYGLQNNEVFIHKDQVINDTKYDVISDSPVGGTTMLSQKDFLYYIRATPITFDHVIRAYDYSMNEVVTKNNKVIIASTSTSTTDIKHIAIGDSYTSPCTWIQEIDNKIPNYESLGTVNGHNISAPTQRSEGRSGWRLSSNFNDYKPANIGMFSTLMHPIAPYTYYGSKNYIVYNLANPTKDSSMYSKLVEIGFDATTGYKLTPSTNDVMWNSTTSTFEVYNGTAWVTILESELNFSINFSKYRSTWNITQPTHVTIGYGVNELGLISPNNTKNTIYPNYKILLDSLIESIKIDTPDVKIAVLCPPTKYGTVPKLTAQYLFYNSKSAAVFTELLIKDYDNRVLEDIYVLTPALCLDTTYGFGEISEDKPFSTFQNTVKVLRTSDPVHPNGGAMQLYALGIAGWMQSTR